jgi:hypothetical protein
MPWKDPLGLRQHTDFLSLETTLLIETVIGFMGKILVQQM